MAVRWRVPEAQLVSRGAPGQPWSTWRRPLRV